MNDLYNFVYRLGCEIEFIPREVEKLQRMIGKMADERAEEISEKYFNAQKEEYRIEIIQEINAANIKMKAAEISRNSPYITETVFIDGKELHRADFIAETPGRYPLYEDVQLICNSNYEYQLLYKNGKRKYVSDFVVVACIIVNATGPGCCKAIIVYIRGVETPLIFEGGDISLSELRRQTQFLNKGLNIPGEVYLASFIQAMSMCSNVFFLTIPELPGMNLMQDGRYDYTSSLSVMPGLEKLYPDAIVQHKLIQHERVFEEVVMDYRTKLPNFWYVKMAIAIRVTSLLLFLYEAEGLRPDRVIVFTPNNTAEKEAFIALTKRYNYTSTNSQSLSDRITKVRASWNRGNDMTVIYTYLGCEEKSTYAFSNALENIRMEVIGENGLEVTTRKIAIILTDVPGNISEEYPAYYLSFPRNMEMENVDTSAIQHLSGEFDYSLIQFLVNNPDAARKLIHESVSSARELLSICNNVRPSRIMTMLIATTVLLKKLNLVSGAELQEILNWFGKEATSRLTLSEATFREFSDVVSEAILSGELKVAKQFGPPYYCNDGYTAFIAENDKSINMEVDVIENIILPKMSVRNKVKMNKLLATKGVLITKHSKKRGLKVQYDSYTANDVDAFSYSRIVLNNQAKAYVDDIIYNEFWFKADEYPEGFVPVLCNADGIRTAGYVYRPDMDENLHEVYYGATRSGKTYSLVNRMLMKIKAEGMDKVIVFDQTGAFTPTELEKHIGKELVSKYFSFWNVYEEGLPVNLINLDGCNSRKEEKDRLTRMYAIISRTLGSY